MLTCSGNWLLHPFPPLTGIKAMDKKETEISRKETFSQAMWNKMNELRYKWFSGHNQYSRLKSLETPLLE